MSSEGKELKSDSEIKKVNKSGKSVYLGLSASFLHHGHIRLINHASNYGEVIVGILTDNALTGHKALPYLSYEHRREIILGIKGVVKVVKQNEWDYSANLLRIKPDYFCHGDDWNFKGLDGIRLKENAIEALNSYGGNLIEVPHTPGIKDTDFEKFSWLQLGTPEVRSEQLRRVLLANRYAKKVTRAIESHSPLAALVAENSEVLQDGESKIFHAFWSSSLTDSTLLGKPDTESLDLTTRVSNVERILAATSRPVIYDGDTGGRLEHFDSMIKSVERAGVSAIVIEDKVGLKRNSLLGNDVEQNQASIAEFSEKIKVGKLAQLTNGFMIFARIESLVLDKSMEDAITRAESYVTAGADGIFISSKSKNSDEVIEFSQKFREMYPDVWLTLVPSTYSSVYEADLYNAGVDLVIYANHLLRASYPAMKRTALSILTNERSLEAESDGMLSIQEILKLIPGTGN
jgi:phosphoenolpyruvate mutase